MTPTCRWFEWCMDAGMVTIAARLDEILANFPNRFVAGLLRFIIQPMGPRRRGPSDTLTRTCANILMGSSATRDRLTVGLFHPKDDGGLARLENAFKLTLAAAALRDRMNKAHVRDIDQAFTQGLLNESEVAQLKAAAEAVAATVAVDDFAADELTRHDDDHKEGDGPSQVQTRGAAAE